MFVITGNVSCFIKLISFGLQRVALSGMCFFCFCDHLSRFSEVQSQPSWDIQSTNDICSHIHLFSQQTKSHEKQKRLKVQMKSWWRFIKINRNLQSNSHQQFDWVHEKSEQSSCFIIDTTQSIWNTKLLAVLTLTETPTLKLWNFRFWNLHCEGGSPSRLATGMHWDKRYHGGLQFITRTNSGWLANSFWNKGQTYGDWFRNPGFTSWGW